MEIAAEGSRAAFTMNCVETGHMELNEAHGWNTRGTVQNIERRDRVGHSINGVPNNPDC